MRITCSRTAFIVPFCPPVTAKPSERIQADIDLPILTTRLFRPSVCK